MDLRDKKILVTGGTGFLGSHLVQKLLEGSVPKENIFAPQSKELDLRIKKNCERAIRGQDIVIHLAGITGDTQFHKEHPAEIFYGNLMMGVELIEAARREGIEKFITIGSATEYPDNTPQPFREENLWLGFPEAVHAPYAIAKEMLLVQAQAYRQQYGFNAIHLLLTNMYGPGKETKRGFIVANIIKMVLTAEAKGGHEIEIWGTGASIRDFLYVEDAARGIILAVENYNKPESVNLGSGLEVSIKDLAELICRLMEFNGSIRWNAMKPENRDRRVLDTSRAEQEFGFRAKTPLEDGLLKTIAYYRSLDGQDKIYTSR